MGSQMVSIRPEELSFPFTLQAQREYPPDMQCKDKFLVQSAKVPSNIDPDEIPSEAFNKDGEGKVEECKLKVVYTAPSSHGPQSIEDHLLFNSSMLRSSRHTADSNSMHSAGSSEESQAMIHLREERDTALQRHRKLQQELEMLKKSQLQRGATFSLKLIIMVGLVGILIGYMLSFAFSIRSSEKVHGEL